MRPQFRPKGPSLAQVLGSGHHSSDSKGPLLMSSLSKVLVYFFYFVLLISKCQESNNPGLHEIKEEYSNENNEEGMKRHPYILVIPLI